METSHADVTTEQVRHFWESNPLCAAAIPHARGSREYFEFHNKLREEVEPLELAERVHEFGAFRGKKVLEVGCGNGYALSKYAAAGADVYGVDLTEAAVQLTTKRFEWAGLKGNFQIGDAQNLPFEDATFDCVCSMGVLHHVPDTRRAFGEVFRVLKPGGRVIVMLYHRNSALYQCAFRLLSLVKGKSMVDLVNEVDGVGNPKGQVYSSAEMRDLLAPYRSVETFAGCIKGEMVLPKYGHWLPQPLLDRFESRWGWFLYGKGIKP
ncbi:MAG: class I SAM-dependent methyltransferase [Polyangiaceae bacterium]